MGKVIIQIEIINFSISLLVPRLQYKLWRQRREVLFTSQDGGKNWELSKAELENIPINQIVVTPQTSQNCIYFPVVTVDSSIPPISERPGTFLTLAD